MSCAKWVTFLSIFLFFSSHLLRNPFLHFPTKRCLSPQFVFPLLTHTFKVDGDSDPIDLSSSQLQLSFSAARTDSSRLKTHLVCRLSFISYLVVCRVFCVCRQVVDGFSSFLPFPVPIIILIAFQFRFTSFSCLNIFLPSLPYSNTTVEFPNISLILLL